jgi:hypothetical protein
MNFERDILLLLVVILVVVGPMLLGLGAGIHLP